MIAASAQQLDLVAQTCNRWGSVASLGRLKLDMTVERIELFGKEGALRVLLKE